MIRVLRVILMVWVVLTNLQPAVCIVNRKRNSSSTIQPQFYPRRETNKRKSYLQSNRPLWVLEDKVNRPGEINVPLQTPSVRKTKSKRRFIASVTSPLRLPSHYINLGPSSSVIGTVPARSSRTRNKKKPKNQRVFPVFDDYGTESDPIFIYRGAKAKMIFNTMMSKKKYPMKEPVPGQVMYPPYSPKFKPTPVVESARAESYTRNVARNLTLIPFYTHEATVDPRLGSIDPRESSHEMKNPVTEGQSPRKKEECHNCYHSYYSQNDVKSKYWSLPYITPTPESTTPLNLQKQIEVPTGIYTNNRIEETTPIPPDDDGDDLFRITYGREIQNPLPKKRYRSVLSAKYKPLKNQSKEVAPVEGDVRKSTAPEETWLIWNLRNREAHKSNYLNSISIKDIPKNHKMSRMLDHKIMIK